MNKFRVKIDLSNFFNDERKLTFILIDPCWDSVSCLQKRVEEIFDLDGLWFVTLEGCFLPPQESIHVIKSDDVLKAFTGLDSEKKKQKKGKRFRVSDEVILEKTASPESEELGPKLKTRKRNTLDTVFTRSTPNEARSRNETVRPIGRSSTVVNEITSTNEQLGFIRFEQQQQPEHALQISNFSSKEEDMDSCDTGNQEQSAGSSPAERVKKRKRKKSQKQKDLAGSTVNATTGGVVTNNHSSDDSFPTSHEFYNNLERVSTTSTDKKCLPNEYVTKVIFHCPLMEAKFEKPRIFPLKINRILTTNHFNAVEDKKDNSVVNGETGSQNNAPSDCEGRDGKRLTKSPIIIQEHIVIPQPIDKVINKRDSITEQSSMKQITSGPDDSSVIAIESEGECEIESGADSHDENNITSIPEVIDLNASDDDQQRKNIQIKPSKKPIKRLEGLSITKMVPFTVNLVNLPRSGDIVIFKLQRLDGITSGYIAGKCENVNSRTRNIKLYIIDGVHEIKGISRKYLCLVDDSNATPERYLQVRLSDMIKPKLFSENGSI